MLFLVIGGAILLGLGNPVPAEAQKAPSAQSIRRLDGSVITPSEVDATLSRLMRNREVTGVGLALLNDSRIVYLKSYGFRDKEKNLPLTPDSVMSAASFTKAAFASLAMQLMQEGKLDLDAPVYEYLPKPLTEYQNYEDLADDERYKKITARMLLSHTSGFPNWRRFNDDKKLHIHFEPGARFAYSGEGIDLLQLVVETITKQPLRELMAGYVFKPYGMNRTSMVWEPRFEGDYANGYDEQGHSLGPQRRSSADAAGSMQTTPRDFAQFVAAIMSGQGFRGETQKQMLSPQVKIFSKHEFPTLSAETSEENKNIRLSYGLGWGLYWTPYGKASFKEGHDDGWRHYTVCFADAKLGIVIMTNSSNGEAIYRELLEAVQKNTFTPLEWEGFTK